MLSLSSQQKSGAAMLKKIVGLCLGLIIIGFYTAMTAKAADTDKIKFKESGSIVSANFDFDHANLSTPASYINGGGISKAGKFTSSGVDEVAPDGKPCTVPGRVAGAGTEFTLAGDVALFRFTDTGDLLFLKSTSETLCEDFSTFPTPPFPFVQTGTGVITGGTGAYSGATGTITLELDGALLSLDATGVRAFGWFEDTGVMTVTVP
jgi:hypothetical protein